MSKRSFSVDSSFFQRRQWSTNQFCLVSLTTLLTFVILLRCDYSGITQQPYSFGNPRIPGNPCSGRYIYMHDLPPKFNQQLLDNCDSITPGTEKGMCPYLVNGGFGREINDEEGILLNQSWHSTNQFLLSVIFHERMKRYECLTEDSSLASAVYVPFYAGLDISRFLWGTHTISEKDELGLELVKWLAKTKEWRRLWGRDHFMVAGRIAWDLRRKSDREDDWGSKLRFLPESKNMSMLAIEASSWKNDHAIPYPTCFHPRSDGEILEWQAKLRSRKRRHLFSFAGAARSELEQSIRGKVIEECLNSGSLCKLLECEYGPDGAIVCNNPANVMRVFQDSVFCLQPSGDSYTRRSIFDAILAGCIPVFFNPGTAYAQYKWHLPVNYKKYSVYIPVRNVKMWRPGVNETLMRISERRIRDLREEVLKLIPRVVYAHHERGNGGFEDAFDLAVKGMIEKVEDVRWKVRRGKDPGAGFYAMDNYRYVFDGYVGEK